MSLDGGGELRYSFGPPFMMRCPKCGDELSPVRVDDTEVDRCQGCYGLWFDARELERLRGRPAAEVIDDGDAKVGRALDGQTRVACPRCRVPMVRMLDHEQRHVWIERCGTCGGTWLDAGEFRDLSHFWIGDVIKGWFARARR